MRVEIVTPDSKVFDGEVEAVQIPGINGSFEILKGHAPIVSAIDSGKLRVKQTGEQHKFFDVTGGIVEVVDNKVAVLAEIATPL
ncbi:MAG: ATP synthase F1 subunit epsilon [Cytophagales bacterium]